MAEITYTPEEFEALPDTKGWELIDGKPVEKDQGEVRAAARRTPPLTPEEFEGLSGMSGWELIDGTPVEKHMGNENGLIQLKIARRLGAFVEDHRLGEVFVNDAGYICFPHRPKLVRKPDVSFVRTGRFPNDRPPRGYARLVPDLCVEVVSPNDLYEEVDDKVNDYLLVNVPMIWVVNAVLQTVLVYLADGTIRRYTADQELPGDPLLPGFRVRVADLFPPPLPPTVQPA
jgi:Uma2 family endonuclease